VRFQLVFNFDGLDEGQREKCETAIRAINEVNKSAANPRKHWCTIRITEYASVPIDSDEDWDKTLKKTLDSGLGRLRDFEDRLSKNQQAGI